MIRPKLGGMIMRASRTQVVAWGFMLGLAVAAVGADQWFWEKPAAAVADDSWLSGQRCQILDRPQPVYDVTLGYIPDSIVQRAGETTVTELGANWNLAYFRDVLPGDIDVAFHMETFWFGDDVHGLLPDQLAKLAFDVGYTQRLRDGIALQGRIYPGYYGDFEEFGFDALFMPFSVAVISSFDPQASWILGLDVRPSFQQVVMPRVGIAYEASKALRIEAGLPDSRITCFISDSFSLNTGFEWNNTSFAMDDSTEDPRDLATVEDLRYYIGMDQRLSDQIQAGLQMGIADNRKVRYDHHGDDYESKISIEDSFYARFVLTGPF